MTKSLLKSCHSSHYFKIKDEGILSFVFYLVFITLPPQPLPLNKSAEDNQPSIANYRQSLGCKIADLYSFRHKYRHLQKCPLPLLHAGRQGEPFPGGPLSFSATNHLRLGCATLKTFRQRSCDTRHFPRAQCKWFEGLWDARRPGSRSAPGRS